MQSVMLLFTTGNKDELEQAETWTLKAQELAHKIDKIDQRKYKDNRHIRNTELHVIVFMWASYRNGQPVVIIKYTNEPI